MNLVWKRKAIADRENIMDFVAQDNPVAALKIDTLFRENAALLTEFPDMGRPGRMKGTREWVAHPNYVIVYRITGDPLRVEVLRVLHTARQWPRTLK